MFLCNNCHSDTLCLGLESYGPCERCKRTGSTVDCKNPAHDRMPMPKPGIVKLKDFESELTDLLNRYSLDARLGIPDRELSEYLVNHLRDLQRILQRRRNGI